jgi:hypothetical protein
MKDAFGRELKVGDQVVKCWRAGRSAWLERATVAAEVDHKSAPNGRALVLEDRKGGRNVVIEPRLLAKLEPF